MFFFPIQEVVPQTGIPLHDLAQFWIFYTCCPRLAMEFQFDAQTYNFIKMSPLHKSLHMIVINLNARVNLPIFIFKFSLLPKCIVILKLILKTMYYITKYIFPLKKEIKLNRMTINAIICNHILLPIKCV